MNKTIREASTRLLALLPSHSSHYSIDDLIRVGFPESVVERIQVDLADALSRSVRPPVTEWADMGSARVQEAWRGFIDAIHTEVVLPRNRAADIIDNAVIEVIEALVMPRRRLPELLFGLHRQLTLPELMERARYVTVHRVLVDALARYMDRKGLQRIDRATAVSVIATVDERYVASFTPLNWAQALDPLFKLAGARVDPDLIRDYFIDKGRDDLAVRFEHLGYRVERSHLIELLSAPVVDDDQPEKRPVAVVQADDVPEEQPVVDEPPMALYESGPQAKQTLPEAEAIEPEPDLSVVQDPVSETETEPEEPDVEDSQPVEEVDATETTLAESLAGVPETAEDVAPETGGRLLDLFATEQEQEQEEEQKQEQEQEQEQEEEQFQEQEQVVALDTVEQEREAGEKAAAEDETPESTLASRWIAEEPDDDETPPWSDRRPTVVDGGIPIWQRFLSEVPDEPEDQPEVPSTLFDALSERASSEQTDGPVPALGVPSYSETAPSGGVFPPLSAVPGPDRGSLRGRLKANEPDFVAEIFGGDKTDYLQAVQSLEMMEDWKQAQQYIKREILPAAGIDPYDDVFVAFVDELQAYFSS